MTARRRLLLAAAALLPLALAACDNKCPTSTAKISQAGGGGVPTCADIKAGQTVTVALGVCPRCDQSNDVCTVTLPDAADPVRIQLDPLVQTCDANPSCPVNPSCAPVTCTFRAPAAGSYTLLVVDPDLGPIEKPFTVVDGGANTSCGV